MQCQLLDLNNLAPIAQSGNCHQRSQVFWKTKVKDDDANKEGVYVYRVFPSGVLCGLTCAMFWDLYNAIIKTG